MQYIFSARCLQVNFAPSLQTDTRFDFEVKSAVVTDLFNIMMLRTTAEHSAAAEHSIALDHSERSVVMDANQVDSPSSHNEWHLSELDTDHRMMTHPFVGNTETVSEAGLQNDLRREGKEKERLLGGDDGMIGENNKQCLLPVVRINAIKKKSRKALNIARMRAAALINSPYLQGFDNAQLRQIGLLNSQRHMKKKESSGRIMQGGSPLSDLAYLHITTRIGETLASRVSESAVSSSMVVPERGELSLLLLLPTTTGDAAAVSSDNVIHDHYNNNAKQQQQQQCLSSRRSSPEGENSSKPDGDIQQRHQRAAASSRLFKQQSSTAADNSAKGVNRGIRPSTAQQEKTQTSGGGRRSTRPGSASAVVRASDITAALLEEQQQQSQHHRAVLATYMNEQLRVKETGFRAIFPTASTTETYRRFFEESRSENELLGGYVFAQHMADIKVRNHRQLKGVGTKCASVNNGTELMIEPPPPVFLSVAELNSRWARCLGKSNVRGGALISLTNSHVIT